ncbi:microtubule-associated tumor suppressor 1 homolog A-like [Gambusia affinis]|uniref:microtubule-associated tumor suppressor 1 homolog A-like n=1 Tax=Gambusia affinis TaxID=33528 RepID=UPI001CDC933F|nr:microtubule-associated tumor suppressor 1 homolog A-like [Gambusia affinis]
MKRELLTGEEFSDSESLRRAIIASRMHSDIKHKTKRLLQKEFEQLKVAHIVGEEAFRSQIQKEKEKSDALQQELDQIKTRYEELQSKYEGDVSALRQQAEIFKQEVDKEMKAQSQKMMRDQKIISELGAEKDSLQKQLTVLQQRYCSCEVNYETELENVKTELQDRDELGPPRRKVARHQEPNRENYTIPVKTIYDPETMDLDHLLENIEFPDASPKELNDFVNEMLRDSSFLDPEAMKVTDLCVETAAAD